MSRGREQRARAPITASAIRWTTAGAFDRPSGSPNTAKPAAIENAFVAAVMSAITGSGRPACRPRWKQKNAPSVASAPTAKPRRDERVDKAPVKRG